MISNLLWYWARYRAERRHLRQMMRGYRLRTGRMALGVIALLAALLLWALWPPQARADAMYVLTVSDYANVREAPSKRAADMGDLYAGDTVRGLCYQQDWVLVEAPVEAGQGWVRADLLTLADSDYQPGRYVNASDARVNIRRTPEGDHADWLAAGDSTDVTRWADVAGVPWGYTGSGWVCGTYMEVAP